MHLVNNQHQGAFINYHSFLNDRKNLQQQANCSKAIENNSRKNSITPDKQHYLAYLKTKYALPKQINNSMPSNSNDLISSLKERNFSFECIYDELIDEFANTLEQLSHCQKNNDV